MNELLFFVADKNMQGSLTGFFQRDAIHSIVRCGPFAFDARRDIKVAAGQNDPGLYTRASELLRPLKPEYRHAVVVVDEEWDSSPGADAIEARLEQHLNEAGWDDGEGLALVVRPEADNWLWSDTPHTAQALGWESWAQLSDALVREGWLEPGEVKPKRPKEAAEWALRHGQRRVPRSSSLYQKIAGGVSVRQCRDSAVEKLLETLCRWFPAEGA